MNSNTTLRTIAAFALVGLVSLAHSPACGAHKPLFTLKGHTRMVRCVMFSPDGKRLASASDDGTVKVWEVSTGKELLTFRGHQRAGFFHDVRGVAFSPDGKRIASSGWGNTVRIWNAATGKELLVMRDGHSDILFSPDGKRLATIDPHYLRVRNAATGKVLLARQGTAMHCLAASTDGKRLATGSWGQRIQVWDAATGKEVLRLKGHADLVSSVAFSPDGKQLATTGDEDGIVLVWDINTAKRRRTLYGHKHANYICAKFRPDGKLVAGAGDADDNDVLKPFEIVTLWDSSTGNRIRTLRTRNSDGVISLAFSPNGRRIATGGDNGTVTIWDVSDVLK